MEVELNQQKPQNTYRCYVIQQNHSTFLVFHNTRIEDKMIVALINECYASDYSCCITSYYYFKVFKLDDNPKEIVYSSDAKLCKTFIYAERQNTANVKNNVNLRQQVRIVTNAAKTYYGYQNYDWKNIAFSTSRDNLVFMLFDNNSGISDGVRSCFQQLARDVCQHLCKSLTRCLHKLDDRSQRAKTRKQIEKLNNDQFSTMVKQSIKLVLFYAALKKIYVEMIPVNPDFLAVDLYYD